MEHHHPANGGWRRPEWENGKRPAECIVPRSPVRDADRCPGEDREIDGAPRPAERSGAESRVRRGERIAELHRQVRDGVYDSIATIDIVARRILQSGDL